MTTDLTEAGVAMLRECRESENSDALISVGAVRLANIMADAGDMASRVLHFIGGARSAERMIAGTMLPCQAWGEELGQLTDGALRSAMFLRAWDGELPSAQAAPEPEAAIAVPAHRAIVTGRIGQTPVGPLFHHAIDPADPNGFVVTGLGMAFSLDEPTGFALKDAIVAGLMAVRGSAVAAQG